MKIRLIALFCTLSILFTCFASGCSSSAGNEPAITTAPASAPAFDIILKDIIPFAYVGAAYDVTQIFVEEEGVDYSFKANYQDPESGTTKKLTVKSKKFTPKVEADISLTITAEKGDDTVVKEVVIQMGLTADAIDMLLASDGAAGGDVSGVKKTVTKDTAYLKGDSSVSALSVSFSNPGSETNGTELLDLSHYSLTAYYSDRTWKNAAVTFWVYNPMEKDIQFKLSSYDPAKARTTFWDTESNIQVQTAKAGEWTQITFSLYKLGIEQVLFSAPDGLRDDFLKVLARYSGTGVCNLYIDGVDVVRADSIEGLQTGYPVSQIPNRDFSDLLNSCRVYTEETNAELSTSTKGNGSSDSYSFGASAAIGYPTFYVDFPQVTDISCFDYLKFDVFADKAYPHVTAAIRYIDENGEIQKHGTSFDYRRDEWRTIYVNLDYLHYADLTKAVGICFSVHMDSRFVANEFNCVYFDNVSLYSYPVDQPDLPAATVEDHDLISGPFSVSNTKPGTNGVCKVSTDETGLSKSDSTLLFWTNNASGYPNPVATFMFDTEQDWSNKQLLSVDTHQSNAHYWMGFTIIALDEDGKTVTYFFRHDTVLTNWMTNSFPLSWFHFRDLEGDPAKPEDLKRVIGLKITVDLAVNVTSEVGYIFFDNIYVA